MNSVARILAETDAVPVVVNPASRPLCTRCEAIRDVDGLAKLEATVETLCADALHGSPAFSYPVLRAALSHLLAGSAAPVVIAVWRDYDNAGPVLIGLFAYRIEGNRWGLPMPVVRVWNHLFEFLGAPLIHRDHAVDAINGFLNWLDLNAPRSAPLLLEKVPGDEQWMSCLADALRQRDREFRLFDTHERAAYSATGDATQYLNQSLERKRRKEWRRLRRRMSETGTLEFSTFAVGDDTAPWCDAFLDLERSGWKGAAGTAIACDARTEAFTRAAIAGEASKGRVGFWQLALDGRPVAMGFAFKQPPQAWLLKIAYDEAYARFSPGVLLIFDIMEATSLDPDIEIVDSCAQPDHPMIDRLWRERLAVTDVLIAGSATGRLGFHARCGLETVRRAIRSGLKTLYRQFGRLRTKRGHRP